MTALKLKIKPFVKFLKKKIYTSNSINARNERLWIVIAYSFHVKGGSKKSFYFLRLVFKN